MKKILILSIIVILITISSLSSKDALGATTILLKDKTSCTGAPLHGTWSVVDSRCTIVNFTLNPGDKLTVGDRINSPVDLTIMGVATINIGSRLDNFGIINFQGAVDNGGTITDVGAINNPGGTINNEENGTIYVGCSVVANSTAGHNPQLVLPCSNSVSNAVNENGVINNNLGGAIHNDYSNGLFIMISGTLNNNFGGTIDNNDNIFNNNPRLHGWWGIHNNFGGTISNDGTINTDGFLSNLGTLTNANQVINNGVMDDYPNGIITNLKTIDNNVYGTIDDYGNIINDDLDINNEGTISELCDGHFIGQVPSGTFTQEPCQ